MVSQLSQEKKKVFRKGRSRGKGQAAATDCIEKERTLAVIQNDILVTHKDLGRTGYVFV